MKSKIVIDCDPGHDDAVAILYAARHMDLLGLTTVHGNNTVDNVTHNTLALLTLAKLDIPVAKGAADPIIGRRFDGPNAHGKSGLDGTDLPQPDRKIIDTHAVDFLIETARKHKEELLVAVIGPATNVGLALKREPRFAKWVREFTLMAGSTAVGNMTAVAEANTFNDPEAAQIIFESGTPTRMVGLNVTRVTGTREPDTNRLYESRSWSPSTSPICLSFTAAASSNSSASTLPPCTMSAPSCAYIDESDHLQGMPRRRRAQRRAHARHDGLRPAPARARGPQGARRQGPTPGSLSPPTRGG